jgi:erythromycin esterase
MVRRRRLTHSELSVSPSLLRSVQAIASPLRRPADLDPLLEQIGNASYVLLGEASHGTHEYYAWRDALSRRLIKAKGFSFVAVEGDWPDCYRVNRYVKGYPDSGESAYDVLHNFERWPTWMWANKEVIEFVEWLRLHNDGVSEQEKAGFYGLDVYSLWDSLYQVMGYLNRHDPESMVATRRAFQCFEPYGEDVQEYARATRWVEASCEDEVIDLLAELRHESFVHAHDGREAHFNAEQNAFVLKNAEHYYRTMVRGGPESWNIRDGHMVETLNRLMHHHGSAAKVIVWEHNTHIGDARYTDMADDGMVNVGQLVREQHDLEGVVLVGFSSYRGSVIAGQEWGAPMERMEVPPARPGSWEDVLHQAGRAANQLLLTKEEDLDDELLGERGHRAIGVVYHPAYEHYGNYVPTVLPRRYDALLHIEKTRALWPLHMAASFEHEVPETFPSGL